MFCRKHPSWNSSVYTPGNPALLHLTATTLGLHKYTHMLFPKCTVPSLRTIYAAWKDQGPGSTHTNYLHSTLCLSSVFSSCLEQTLCQHNPSTCGNSICLKNQLSSAPCWKELTGWRTTSERKPFWHLRCGDNQPMNRKSSIRVENCSCTQLVPANICCWN